MTISPLAGKPAPKEMLIDLARLEREYYERKPDLGDPNQLVSFGTSGHRGSPLHGIVHRGAHPGDHPGDLRLPARPGHRRPALHGQGHARAVRAGAAHGARSAGGQRRRDDHPARRRRHADAGHLARHPRLQPRPHRSTSPTASSSRRRTIRRRTAASSTTRPTAARPTPTSPAGSQDRANELLRDGNAGVKRVPFAAALQGRDARTRTISSCPTSATCANVVDMDAIRDAGLKLGVDPLGGAAVPYWEPINAMYGLDIDGRESDSRSDLLVHDGRSRRQDPHGLLQPVRDGEAGRAEGSVTSVAFGNDPDADRHGIVTPSAGLMNPNHYLAVAIRYLLTHRPQLAGRRRGRQDAGQQQHDRPRRRRSSAAGCARCRSASSGSSPGLFDGSCCFGGEESAGASFLRRDGTVWTTDKDGLIMDLLAAEITAAHRQGSRRALPRADGRVRHAVLHAHRRAGDARAEGDACRSSRPRRSRRRHWPASRSRPS